MNPVAALLFSITIVNIFLSSFIFFRNISSNIHRSLAAFIFLVGVWTLSMGMFYQVTDLSDARFWIKATYITGIIIANTLVYFALVFPQNEKLPFLQILSIYLPSLPLLAAFIIFPTFLHKEIINYGWWKDVLLGTPEYIVYTIYFTAVYYGALFIVWRKYTLYRGTTKIQILYLLVSLLIAGSFGAIFDLLFPWLALYKFIWLGPIGTVIMIGIILYATARHKLIDLRFAVARTVAYTLIITLVGVIYATFFFTFFSVFFPQFRRFQLVFYVAATLILMYSFERLRNTMDRLTDKIFFKDKYDSNELLLKMAEIMASTIHLEEITQKTLSKLLETMHIARGSLVLVETGAIKSASLGFDQNPTYKKEDIEFLYNQQKTVLLDEEAAGPLLELLRSLDISISLPLFVQTEPIGVLLLGAKKSGDTYSHQDVDVLEILSPEMAVAIQNAQSFDEISKFNITLRYEVERATRELRFANEKLKELDKLKDEFVSVASHELRTPMTAIKSYLWMVLENKGGEVPVKQKEYLDRAYNSTERLIKLVNDMLNVSRIESGRITIEKQMVSIEKIAEDVLLEVKPRADELKLNIFIERPQGRPVPLPKVEADQDKIKEVMINLVGNSLKFTPEGGTIKISFELKQGMIETRVQDSGKGIAPQDLPRLFKKFEMIEGSYTRSSKAQGSGLGLYISRQIIALHGGQIWAESEIDKGSTFIFTLPIAKDPSQR